MPFIVTVDMYSGRPNPTWELSESDARKLQEMLARNVNPAASNPAVSGVLGYRGMQVTHVPDSSNSADIAPTVSVFAGAVMQDIEGTPTFLDSLSEIEEFLVGTAGTQLDQFEVNYLREEIKKTRQAVRLNSPWRQRFSPNRHSIPANGTRTKTFVRTTTATTTRTTRSRTRSRSPAEAPGRRAPSRRHVEALVRRQHETG